MQKEKLEILENLLKSEVFKDFKEAVESYRDSNYQRAMDSTLDNAVRVNYLEKIRGASEVYGYFISLKDYYSEKSKDEKGE